MFGHRFLKTFDMTDLKTHKSDEFFRLNRIMNALDDFQDNFSNNLELRGRLEKTLKRLFSRDLE